MPPRELTPKRRASNKRASEKFRALHPDKVKRQRLQSMKKLQQKYKKLFFKAIPIRRLDPSEDGLIHCPFKLISAEDGTEASTVYFYQLVGK
jgi:hypothetical protein